MKSLSALIVVIALAGCSGPRAVAPESADQIKTIGVISTIGDSVRLRTVGLIVFGNKDAESSIESWELDNFVVTEAGSLLAKRYDVRPVKYDRAAFFAGSSTGTSGNEQRALGQAIHDAASPNDLDAYAVVVKVQSQFGGSNQWTSGLGLLQGSGVFAHTVYMHALYAVAIVDGHQGKVLGVAAAPAHQEFLTKILRGPYRKIESSAWPDTLDAMSDTEKQQLRDGLKELIHSSMPEVMTELKLLP